MAKSQTICNRGREEQQSVVDMDSFVDSHDQALQDRGEFPEFDPYLDDPLPLTPFRTYTCSPCPTH